MGVATAPRVGDEVHFRDFGGCRIIKLYDDGSVDLEIPGLLGTEKAEHGQWRLKERETLCGPADDHQLGGRHVEAQLRETLQMEAQQSRHVEAHLRESLQM